MAFYSLKMGLTGSEHQPQVIQILKSAGDDVIQVSDGLCIKTEKSMGEIESLLQEKEITGLQLSEIKRDADDLSKDVEAFLAQEH